MDDPEGNYAYLWGRCGEDKHRAQDPKQRSESLGISSTLAELSRSSGTRCSAKGLD